MSVNSQSQLSFEDDLMEFVNKICNDEYKGDILECSILENSSCQKNYPVCQICNSESTG